MIPTKIIVTGDIPAGKEFIGFAKNQLSILRKEMSFQKLNEGARTVKPFPGVIVECWSSFNLSEIRIHMLPGAGGVEEAHEEKKIRECLCLPNFSFAIIVAAEYGGDADEAVYDAEVCTTTDYVLYIGLRSNGWARYYVGQFVLVTVGDEMEAWEQPLDCGRDCLIDTPRFDNLMVSPISIPSKMHRWIL